MWGRGIRYGDAPAGDDDATIALRSRRLVTWLAVSERLRDIEQAVDHAARVLQPRIGDTAAAGLDPRELRAAPHRLLAADPEQASRIQIAIEALGPALSACGSDISGLVARVWDETAAELGLP